MRPAGVLPNYLRPTGASPGACRVLLSLEAASVDRMALERSPQASVEVLARIATGGICSRTAKARPKSALVKSAGPSTGEFRDVEECTEDRLDRRRPHGDTHGGTPAQGRPRRDHLEPHARESRAACGQGRQDRSTSRSSWLTATWCSPSCPTGKDAGRGCFRQGRRRFSGAKTAEDASSTARRSRLRNPPTIRKRLTAKRRELSGGAGVRQCQGDQGRTSYRRSVSGPEAARKIVDAADRSRSLRRACPM